MRRLVLGFSIIILLLTTISLYPEQTIKKKIEKLEKKLETVSGREKIDVLNEISYEYYYLSPGKAIEYGNHALELSKKLKEQKGEATALRNISRGYIGQGSYEKALDYAQKSLKIFKEIGDKKGIAGNLNNIGVIYYILSNYENALEYHLKSLKIEEEIGNKRGIAASLNNIGIIYKELSNYLVLVSFPLVLG